jgi:hypothetical protein
MTDLTEVAPERFRVTESDNREDFQSMLNINAGQGWVLLHVSTAFDTTKKAIIHTAVWHIPAAERSS